MTGWTAYGETSPLLVAIVLVYNRWEHLRKCLPALLESTYPILRVIVVDNGSTVPAPQDVESLLKRIEVIRNSENLGYAGGNNIGIVRAMALGAEYILLANDDAYLAKDCLERLVAVMEADQSAGALGPLVFDAREPDIVLSACGLWSKDRLSPYQRGSGEKHRGQYTTLLPSFYVDGCCLLLRTSAMERVGLLDESFFFFFEEVDLCVRLRALGYGCFVVPWARVEHEGSGTAGRGSSFSKYFYTRNRFLFARKTTAGPRRFVHILWILCTEATLVKLLLKNPRNPALWGRARGILDGLLGIKGRGPTWICPQ